MRNTTGIVLLLSLVVFTGCGADQEAIPTAAPVRIMEVTPQPITQEVFAAARLEGEAEALIIPAVGGRIEEVLVREGDMVETGDPLVRLVTDQQINAGTTAAIASINAARAAAENADRTLERISTLYEAGAVSEHQLDGAQAQAEAARAQLVQAQAGYSQAASVADNSHITAPFSGRVGRVWAREGNMAGGSQPLLSIASANTIIARVLLPERYLGEVAQGQPSRVQLTTDETANYPGTVTSAAMAVDPVSGMVAAEVRFPNEDGELMPGMSGRVAIGVETSENALSVPEIALIQSAGGYRLAVEVDGRAEVRDVTTGITSMGMVEVTEGLQSGDHVIVQGQFTLQDGDEVEVAL